RCVSSKPCTSSPVSTGRAVSGSACRPKSASRSTASTGLRWSTRSSSGGRCTSESPHPHHQPRGAHRRGALGPRAGYRAPDLPRLRRALELRRLRRPGAEGEAMTAPKKATRQRYARLMGDFWRHPRTANLSTVAAGILCRAWSYCADQMTDGEVPRFIVAAFFGGNPDEAVVRELVEAGLWEEASAGYRMRDWAERNITKAAWEERKAKARERVQRYREREAANGNASRNALQEPVPTRYE